MFTATPIAPMEPVGKKLLAQPRHRHHLVTGFTMSNSSNPAMRKTSAFTLIELLIVIAIIGILMSLLFPAAGTAITAAKKAQSKNDATQIATALVGYQTEYGKWPAGVTGELAMNVGGSLLDELMGTNARQITFLEVNTYKRGKSGISGGNFVDPWKQEYQVMVDYGYDNRLSGVPGAPSPLVKSVAVWSSGAPKKGTEKGGSGYEVNTDTNKYTKSWE